MRKVLPAKFFARPTLAVARDLLGKYIVREWRGRTIALMITEVEAYDGPHDRASHASRGRTPRTSVMFGPAGVFYVYFTYGMHWMLNIVTGRRDYPAAVLIRAGAYRVPAAAEKETVGGANPGTLVRVTGPARLAKFLHATGAQNRLRAVRATGLWFEDRGVRVPRAKIARKKRVGVDYAGAIWAEKPYNLTMLP